MEFWALSIIFIIIFLRAARRILDSAEKKDNSEESGNSD